MAASSDDRESILEDIEQRIRHQQAQLRSQAPAYKAQASGARLPVIVNTVLVTVVLAVLLILWQGFVGDQEAYALRASGSRELDGDIVAALLAQNESALDEKEAAIRTLRTDLAEVNERLAEIEAIIAAQLSDLRTALEAEDVAEVEIVSRLADERSMLESEYADERGELLARRDSLSEELAVRIREQEALLAQIATQRQILDDGAGSGGESLNELERLQQQEQLEAIFEQRLLSGYRELARLLSAREWDVAGDQAVELERFLLEEGSSGGDRAGRRTHVQLVGQLSELIGVAEEGWPDEPTEDVLPGWDTVRERIAAAQSVAAAGDTERAVELYRAALVDIPGVQAGVGLLTERAQERSTTAISQAVSRSRAAGSDDPQALLEVLTDELDASAATVPQAVRDLTQELRTALGSVARQRAELESLTELSQRQLALLRQSVDADSQAAPQATTVEAIAEEIEALQMRVAESRERQERLEETVTTLEAENSDLLVYREEMTALQEQYRTRTQPLGTAPSPESIPEARSALDLVAGSFRGATADQYFPRFYTRLMALVETVVDLESARAAAEAEAAVLAEVQTATERVTEEQMRLLAFSDTADQNTMELLDSLVQEIDTLAVTRREAREEVDYAQALGVIVRTDDRDGTIVVQRASQTDTSQARRVFVNRQLPNGDRIPIADVEVVATSGENTIVRVVSTIAPTIFPQVNDIVYAEF